VANTLSIGFDVRRWSQCSAGKSKNASRTSRSFVRQATALSYLAPYLSANPSIAASAAARVLAERGGVTLAFCWSHVRRRFYELAAAGAAPIASEALERIGSLYRIETEIRGRGADERRVVRRDKSRPIIDALEPWLREKLGLISQKTKLAEAIRYALSRWEGLTRFLDDGRIEIDSNVVERTIRPIALNRKNALFAGSDGGGEVAYPVVPGWSKYGILARMSGRQGGCGGTADGQGAITHTIPGGVS
jgi:hypothetical protein